MYSCGGDILVIRYLVWPVVHILVHCVILVPVDMINVIPLFGWLVGCASVYRWLYCLQNIGSVR